MAAVDVDLTTEAACSPLACAAAAGRAQSAATMPAPSITSRQRSHLRSLAHALKPIVQVGKTGLTDGVHEAIDGALGEHELIKVKIGQGYEGDKREAARDLAARASADLTQLIGKTVVLYRPRPEVADDPRPRIKLP